MARILCILIILATILELTNHWKMDHKPKVYGDKVPNRLIMPRSKKVQRRIVMLHDYFRNKVAPPAANMLSMKWHRGAARTAQKWANRCMFLTHDSPKGRTVENFGSCGQNIFVSTHKVPWIFALRMWFFERHNFTYGSDQNDLVTVGHYTQMVWAATHKVGCGLAKCFNGPRGKTYYNYVCNYCPIGNYNDRLGYPYKAGRPCGSCVGNCLSKKIKIDPTPLNRVLHTDEFRSCGRNAHLCYKNCSEFKRLCTNSCNAVDLWANCKELYKTWPGWLCNTVTEEGLDRQKKCKATCTCHGKIHE